MNRNSKSKPARSRAAKGAQTVSGPLFPLLGYRPDIDGLRAIAVLSVVGFHAFPKAVDGGFAGVDVFFVISGFLISNQILHRLERGDFSLSDFYARRIRRIFPALIVVLAACLGLGWFALYAGEYAQLGKHIAAGAAFVSNFVLWNESGYFETNSRLKPLLHLWSLGVEEQFYLLWPVTLILAFRLRLKVLAVVMVVLLSSFGFNLYLVGRDASGAFYLPLTRFWELMAGCVLACAFSAPKGRRIYSECASITGLVMVIAAFALLRERMPYPGTWALLPTFGAFLLLSAGPGAWINRHVLANRALVLVGLISYPLYLWHWSLLSFGDIVQSGALSTRARWVIIGVSFVLAALTYLLVERPIRFGGKTRAAAWIAAVFLVAAGGTGWAIFHSGGAPFRAANRTGILVGDLVVPVSTYASDGSCRALGLEPIRNAVCLSNSKRPEVLMIGDSHAIALNSAPFLGKVPLKTLVMAAPSCLPFVDYVSVGPTERKDNKTCTEVAWQILAAARTHPEIQNVVITSRGPVYFSGTSFGVEAEDPARDNWQIEPVDANDATASNQERFRRGFSRMISSLEAFGKTVTFVIDIPELGIYPSTCIPGRPLTFARSAASACTVARTLVDERQAEYRKIVKSLVAEHPKMRVFDPLPVFCDEMLCHGMGDGHLLYYDTNHLTVYGSEQVWKALLPVVSQGSH